MNERAILNKILQLRHLARNTVGGLKYLPEYETIRVIYKQFTHQHKVNKIIYCLSFNN